MSEKDEQTRFVERFQPIVDNFRASEQRLNNRIKAKEEEIKSLKEQLDNSDAKLIEYKRANVAAFTILFNQALEAANSAKDAYSLARTGEDLELIKWTKEVYEANLTFVNTILNDHLEKDTKDVTKADVFKFLKDNW